MAAHTNTAAVNAATEAKSGTAQPPSVTGPRTRFTGGRQKMTPEERDGFELLYRENAELRRVLGALREFMSGCPHCAVISRAIRADGTRTGFVCQKCHEPVAIMDEKNPALLQCRACGHEWMARAS